MPEDPKYSFHDIPPHLQQVLLHSRRSLGADLGHSSGFAGRIFRYEAGTAFACAKVPIVGSYTPKEVATRFLRELKLQRSLYYHQFVHWPFDFDFVHDTPIAWFRFWDSDLAALIENTEFTFEARLAFLAYLASALIHCHSRGLIAHQDLKPENIFVQDLQLREIGLPSAQVWRIPKLADFGSANLASECGVFSGTKAYMAPEQWKQEPLGEHTSVWSLGLIAHELLTFGEHPVGEPTRPWRDRAKGVFTRWQKKKMWMRWLNAGCRPAVGVGDDELNELIRQCLAVDPAERPSLHEFMGRILGALRRKSPFDEGHATFRIFHADTSSRSDHAWPYLDHRFNAIVAAVADRFNDTSIIDRHAITEEEMQELAASSAG